MTTEITRQNEIYGTFSERFPQLYDRTGRVQKAQKIVAVIQDFCGGKAGQLKVLDVGGAAGVMTEIFADSFAHVVELDIDHVAIERGRQQCNRPNVEWVCGDATKLEFADETFDCVICNHVYEHVDDQVGLAREIRRVLRPNGFCYFSAGSRFNLVEGHYKLPFLSWLPNRWANRYMQMTGRQGKYDVTLRSYPKLKKILSEFRFHDYTIPILKHPDRFAANDLQAQSGWAFRIPTFVYKIAYPLLPIWIWILTKK